MFERAEPRRRPPTSPVAPDATSHVPSPVTAGTARRRRAQPVVQAKLQVGAVDDPLEREADRLADEVVRRLRDPGDQGAPPAPSAAAGPAGGDLEPALAGRIERATRAGSPLDDPTRQRMEGAFGTDFSGVRLHTGAESTSLNRELNARAFTTGSHVFLGGDAPSPGSTGGDRLLAHELAHTVQQGAAPVRRSPALVQRDRTTGQNPLYEGTFQDNPLYEGTNTPQFPRVGNVRGEAVIFETDGDEFEATVIMNDIETSYGITISSDKLAKAIPSNYKKAPKNVRDAVQVGVWQMKELRALERALAHYAPILGAARKDSTRGAKSQEVKYIGKVKQAINKNSPKGVLDTTTMGEYFSKQKTFGMFDAGTDSTEDFADNLKQLEATAVHEMAHGLFGHEVKGWAKHFEYWVDQYTESGKGGAEEPPSDYGTTNAAEDLCESVMFYFVDEARLKTNAPLRHAYVKGLVDAWKKQDKKGKK